MAVSKKREDPQPARTKSGRGGKAKKEELEIPTSTQTTGIRARGNSEKPAFLKSKSARVRAEGVRNMMSTWATFNVTPLVFFNEEELQALMDQELSGRRSAAFVQRLHNTLSRKRINRERAIHREICGVDQKNALKKSSRKK